MTFEELKDRALSLPMEPGVYIMRDKTDTVIYVGKAKKLKNRVSQYFQDTASHTPKTRMMVSRIHRFEVIVAASEFEALVLECSLIKRYQPKYNILLKDDKGYPYLRLNMKEMYPAITLAPRLQRDGAEYFGPFGSRGVTQDILESIRHIFHLPSCSKRFPRDIGKGRVCLHYHMNQCDGWCQKTDCHEEFRGQMMQVRELLCGNFNKVAEEIKKEMLSRSKGVDKKSMPVFKQCAFSALNSSFVSSSWASAYSLIQPSAGHSAIAVAVSEYQASLPSALMTVIAPTRS